MECGAEYWKCVVEYSEFAWGAEQVSELNVKRIVEST